MKDTHKTKAQLIEELEALRAQTRDISDISLKQEQLQPSEHGLEQKVQEQVAELKHSTEALEREISDRTDVESQLRESNQLLETVFSNIHMLIAYLDTDFNFIRVNEAYAGASGKPVSFFPGKNHFALYPHEENERIFRSVVATGESYTACAKPFVYPEHPEKTTYWDWTLQPTKTNGKNVTGLILSLLDVTAEVEARKETERYAEELKRHNQTLSEFAFIASHDLQEPLRKILTFGDRLASSLGERLSEMERDYLARMQKVTRRMQTMLDGLLEYSRVSIKTRPYLPVDLTRAVNEAVSNLHLRVVETGAVVSITPLPTIHADFTQMIQLFQNLIGNAIKFQRKDVPPRITVSGKLIPDKKSRNPGASRCELRFEDNGIGFDRKYFERIFLPFERLQGRQGPDGAGMGLAICRKIVERHGGIITAESEPGNGTLFIVTLPVNLLYEGKSA